MKKEVIIRKAGIGDVTTIKHIINGHAAHGLMRPKSVDRLTEVLPNYFVAEVAGAVIGVCGFKIWASDGVELISSAVRSEYHRQGIGAALNKACIDNCLTIGFRRFFVLTKQPEFYAALGFIEVKKTELQAKVFIDCGGCPENEATDPGQVVCSDIAMVLEIED